jgi:RsiW-degrading membrane proteinase PrsW (M82 family)
VFILWRPVVDEAPDYVIYLLTVALGFAATENTLFLLDPVSGGNIASSVFTGDIRFLGATLLHVFSSAAIGFAFAFSSMSRPIVRIAAASLGLILAVALHTAFNALIITQGTSTTLAAVLLVWIAAVIFFAAFEVLKFFQYHTLAK